MSIDADALLAEEGEAHGSGTKGERTRRRLLDLAIDRFGTKGFKGTSVSEVARAAGLTQAASYAYFDNKEALFRAAVDADASELIEGVVVNVAETPVRQMIPAVIVHAVVALENHPLAKRVLSGAEPDEIPRLIELPAVLNIGSLMTEALREGQATGDVRSDLDPVLLGPGIRSLILGILFSMVLIDGQVTEENSQGVVEAFDTMLRPPT